MRQSVTRMPRFSTRILEATDRLIAVGNWPDTIIPAAPDVDVGLTSYNHLRLAEVARMQSYVWNQTNLPRAVPGNTPVSPGDTAQMMSGRQQIIVIRDDEMSDALIFCSFQLRTRHKAQLCLGSDRHPFRQVA